MKRAALNASIVLAFVSLALLCAAAVFFFLRSWRGALVSLAFHWGFGLLAMLTRRRKNPPGLPGPGAKT